MKRTVYLMGMMMHYLTSSAEDGYFLCDAHLQPGAGAPPNRHGDDEESFFVREGTVSFTVDGVERAAGPGEFVKVPSGAIHSFRNGTDAPARMLMLNVPGTIHENVFTTCGMELEEWSKTLDNTLESYWGETISILALSAAVDAFKKHMTEWTLFQLKIDH